MKKNVLNRRSFLKTSVLGTAGAFFVNNLKAAESIQPSYPGKTKDKIVKRKLGDTGLEIPIVSFGVMRTENKSLVQAALDKGITHFETAQAYQNGNNEKMLGEALKEYSHDSFTIATKIAIPGKEKDEQTGQVLPGFKKQDFIDSIDVSLKRLNMDYVDILYFQGLSMRDAVLYGPALEALKTIKQKGKAKHIGVSTHSNEPEVIKAAVDSDVYEVVLTALNFKQNHKEKILERAEEASKAGLGIVAMKTMAGGKIGKGDNQKMKYQAALKWSLQNKYIHTAIPGITSFEQLQENISVMNDLKLSKGEKEFLYAASLQEGLYCDGCKQCLKFCPKNIPIPDMMRAYMYAHGYRQTLQAKEVLSHHGIRENPCKDCNECVVNCPKGFNVPEKIADISRVAQVPDDFLV